MDPLSSVYYGVKYGVVISMKSPRGRHNNARVFQIIRHYINYTAQRWSIAAPSSERRATDLLLLSSLLLFSKQKRWCPTHIILLSLRRHNTCPPQSYYTRRVPALAYICSRATTTVAVTRIIL